MTKPTYCIFPFMRYEPRMSYSLDTERLVFAMGCESERERERRERVRGLTGNWYGIPIWSDKNFLKL